MSLADLLKGETLTAPQVFANGDALLIVVPTPAECRTCHRAVHLLINRLGETKCVSCDQSALRTSAAANP